MSRVAGILLAAGPSSRLGREKQRLSVRGKTFLRGVAESLGALASPLVVVLPAERPELARELSGIPAEVVLNEQVSLGMGTSLALGARALLSRFPALDFVLVALVDQPLVSRALFEDLLAAARGARALLEPLRARGELALVAFPGGRFDVDTEDDYARLLAALEGGGSVSGGSSRQRS